MHNYGPHIIRELRASDRARFYGGAVHIYAVAISVQELGCDMRSEWSTTTSYAQQHACVLKTREHEWLTHLQQTTWLRQETISRSGTSVARRCIARVACARESPRDGDGGVCVCVYVCVCVWRGEGGGAVCVSVACECGGGAGVCVCVSVCVWNKRTNV
jgi:hypothetical protein